MLYPKRELKFSPDDFLNPSAEYRAAPFWAWNNKLDKKDLVWQIEQLKKMGFGGFFMHVRTGLATEYLGVEFMEAVRACVEKARDEKMLAWLYDEDRYSSGFAGGLVTKDTRYRIRHLLITRHPCSYGGTDSEMRSSSGKGENGKLVACYDIKIDGNGCLENYKTIDIKEKANGIKIYAYEETVLPSPWCNNQTYVNTLDPPSIGEFIRITHEAYHKNFGDDFGNLIPAIFTDEPQFSRIETLNTALEDRDICLPWTFDLEDSYRAVYSGDSLTDKLPEIIWELPDNKVSLARYRFHDHVAERFTEAFADQCGNWCAEHGIMLTGHMMAEEGLDSQTNAIGEAMRSYRSFQFPGIDILCDGHEFTTAKQAQSSARQNGSPGVSSELYGVTNWNFDFRGHKLQGDWQAALGVTVRVPHLSWVSMKGEAKRDYPATFNYQSPWFTEYPFIENHFARIASALTRGRAVCRTGVIHPIESQWLNWGVRDSTNDKRRKMDTDFHQLCDWLLRGQIDFDYICESTLPQYCSADDICGKGFPVGEMRYDVIIVPSVLTMRKTTLERLEIFKNAGGRIIFLGDAPGNIDAVPDENGKKLWDKCEKIKFNRPEILDALEEIRELGIYDQSGSLTENLLCQIREEKDGSRWLFIAHADNPVNKDNPSGTIINITIKGEWAAVLYDTVTGIINPLPVSLRNGCTEIIRLLYGHDSLLIKLEKSQPLAVSIEEQKSAADAVLKNNLPDDAESVIIFSGSVPVTLEEPNVLLLDMAEYSLDSGEMRPREEILRIDNILREELGWPYRGGGAQPWVEYDSSTPHTLKLRYAFSSEIAVTGAELALENAETAKVTLNGEKAGVPHEWYVDKCIGRIDLPEIKTGLNVLELIYPYGKKSDIEAIYLLGDFGVRLDGASCIITKPVRSLSFKDITGQGLPFYGGNLIYHLEFETPGDKFTVTVPQYRFHSLRVKVDGKDCGALVYSPYRMEIPAKSGSCKVDIQCFGSRINTFGQVHSIAREPEFRWWGSRSWRTTDDNWSYEYHLWPQGLLKSPEIIR